MSVTLSPRPSVAPPVPRPAVPLDALENAAEFQGRHIGPTAADEARMLAAIGAASCETLIEAIVPASIARRDPMRLPAASASASIASLGLSTGIGTAAAQASIAGPNAEQVNRMASAPQPCT